MIVLSHIVEKNYNFSIMYTRQNVKEYKIRKFDFQTWTLLSGTEEVVVYFAEIQLPWEAACRNFICLS